jgi:predicted transcriptional regulator
MDGDQTRLAELPSASIRSRVEIIASILSEVRLSSTGLRKTKIMYRSNLGFRQLKSYLMLLIEKKFLKIVVAKEGKMKVETYHITKEGLAFLKCYNELKSCLNEERLTR